MPVKQRLAKSRLPQFSAEAISLFIELEHMRRGRRDSREFRDKSKQLANLLGLSSEFWGGCNVNDTSRAPCHPSWCVAYGDFYVVREVREALLSATRERHAVSLPKVTRPETIM